MVCGAKVAWWSTGFDLIEEPEPGAEARVKVWAGISDESDVVTPRIMYHYPLQRAFEQHLRKSMVLLALDMFCHVEVAGKVIVGGECASRISHRPSTHGF